MKIRRPFLSYVTEPEGESEQGGEGGATPPAEQRQTKPAEKATPPADLGDAGKKAIDAMKAERDEARRKAAEAEAKVKEFEDSQKSQAEKDAERLAELEKQARDNGLKALKYEAAEKTGIPLAAAHRLNGESLDDLIKDAEALKELGIGRKTDDKAPTPKPDKSQGSTGGQPAPKSLSGAISAHYEQ